MRLLTSIFILTTSLFGLVGVTARPTRYGYDRGSPKENTPLLQGKLVVQIPIDEDFCVHAISSDRNDKFTATRCMNHGGTAMVLDRAPGSYNREPNACSVILYLDTHQLVNVGEGLCYSNKPIPEQKPLCEHGKYIVTHHGNGQDYYTYINTITGAMEYSKYNPQRDNLSCYDGPTSSSIPIVLPTRARLL
ncbi:hypothetical protein AMATHDRAFT_88743 [Amanita thiersii Skay4041]|uniref:Uncharacterized protein n=1 Tax=Amanita thiersii Skay4041 TaxID=703135 RepID=A0A2A9ND74_9AGAR|nr:hypothetical protein AMATHDRAFT_88743 [Amanita thiersii Skay4041]